MRGAEDTGALLRRLAIGFADAARSGRDDDLWSVQEAAQQAWQIGVRHADLALLMVQLHWTATPSTRPRLCWLMRLGLRRPRPGGCYGPGCCCSAATLRAPAACCWICCSVSGTGGTWRCWPPSMRMSPMTRRRDLLYAEAVEELDARQLATFAWVECQRARLRLGTDRVEAADRHLRRAESAAAGWSVAAVRGRWLEARGEAAPAAAVWGQVATTTDRPDHAQAAAAAAARAGLVEETIRWQGRARTGFAKARRRWPYRYAHHEVDWHLHVDRDVERALTLARADYRQRPARRQAARLTEALRAAGDGEAADRLTEDHLHRQRQARAGLAAALARADSTMEASA